MRESSAKLSLVLEERSAVERIEKQEAGKLVFSKQQLWE